MKLSWLSEDCVPLPLKTRVWARSGETTIIPGVLPAEIGAEAGRISFSASTTYTPAAAVPALTLLLIKARYFRPVVGALPEGAAPQLSHIRLAGSRNNKRIRIFFKPGTPTSCWIIAWMQEQDYSKGRNCVSNQNTARCMRSDGLTLRLAPWRMSSTSTCFRFSRTRYITR